MTGVIGMGVAAVNPANCWRGLVPALAGPPAEAANNDESRRGNCDTLPPARAGAAAKEEVLS